jgi:hypothetical protein
MKMYSDEWWQGVKDFNNSFPINIFKKDKEIIMNPDILPTLEEWRLICTMVKQQRELTYEEISDIRDKHLAPKDCDIYTFAKAILQKAREK